MAENEDVKVYKCTNFGACTKADSGEEIKIPTIETIGGTPPCPHCHQNTLEEQVKKGFPTKIVGIICALVAVAAIGGGIYALTGTSEPKEPLKLALNHTQKTLKVGETDTLIATLTPEGTHATIDWKASNKSNAIVVSSDGIVTAKEEGESKVQVKAVVSTETVSAICSYIVTGKSPETLISELFITDGNFSLKIGDTKEVHYKALPEQNDEQVIFESENPAVVTVTAGVVKAVAAGTTKVLAKSSKSGKIAFITVIVKKDKGPGPISGTLKLSYGTYTGQIENGYPNGQGRLVYNKSRQISKYDSKGRTAQAGESVQGNFKNGFLTIGKHYDASGNLIESLNIGSPVEGVFESK